VSWCVCGELGGVYGYVVAAGILCRGSHKAPSQDQFNAAQEKHCKTRRAEETTVTRDQQLRRSHASVVAIESCIVAQTIHRAKPRPHLRAPQDLPNPRSSSSLANRDPLSTHQRRHRAASRLHSHAAKLLCSTNSNTTHPPNRTFFPHPVASASPSPCLPSTPTARMA
jgi:hypothetical protein